MILECLECPNFSDTNLPSQVALFHGQMCLGARIGDSYRLGPFSACPEHSTSQAVRWCFALMLNRFRWINVFFFFPGKIWTGTPPIFHGKISMECPLQMFPTLQQSQSSKSWMSITMVIWESTVWRSQFFHVLPFNGLIWPCFGSTHDGWRMVGWPWMTPEPWYRGPFCTDGGSQWQLRIAGFPHMF